MSTTAVILIILLVAVAGIVIVALLQRQNSRKLRDRFGPEYDRLARENNPRKAETILHEREKRIAKFQIRPLTRQQSEKFAAEWRAVQEHFVDDPRGATSDADRLIDQVLEERGYPVGDFEQQADDLSVEHARVIEHYRVAHDIASRDRKGAVSTEDLRIAMQHYRAMFEDLLDMPVTKH
jgi:hypothetical protein